MKDCPKCHNLAQDSDTACPQCGTVLDQSVIARASGAGRRMPTVAEGMDSARSAAPPKIEYRPSPPPLPASFPSPVRATVAASAPPPAISAPPPPVPQPQATPSGRRGSTVLMPTGAEAGSPQIAATTPARRIIAVLVTYSWKPEGQVFPIREGRNIIGRGEHCDVRIAEDPMLSAENSHITFRQNFTVGDMVSMGGTYVNGDPVEEQFRPLSNLASIRAGSTQLQFVIVDPKLL